METQDKLQLNLKNKSGIQNEGFVPNSTSIFPANANFMFRIGVKNVCGSDPTLTFQCFSEFA